VARQPPDVDVAHPPRVRLRPFARENSELTFPLDPIRCEVRVIDRENDGKRFAFRQIHECGVGEIHVSIDDDERGLYHRVHGENS